MAVISDEYMREMIFKTKSYCVVVLKALPKRNSPGIEKIIWEHGRRNFSLRADGKLAVVCPISDDSSIRGIGIFDGNIDEVEKIMDEDPGVKEGIFEYEVHACRSFPG